MNSLIQHSRALALAVLLLASAGCRTEGDGAANGGAGDSVATGGTVQADTVPAISPERAAQEVNALLQSVTRAAASGDLAALDRYYAPDVHIIDRNGFTEGWNTYRAANLQQTAAMLSKTAGSSYRTGNATVKVAGNVAWASFPYEVTADVDGRPTQIFGYGTATLRNDGGEWRIVQTQTSGRPRKSSDPTF